MIRRPFVLLFLALVLIQPSCSTEPLPGPALAGQYKCSFAKRDADVTYLYPDFACVIRRQGGHLELEKLSGSQRIRGPISPTASGFFFSGLYFCPYGECNADVAGEFTRVGEGVFRGVIRDKVNAGDETIVTLKAE